MLLLPEICSTRPVDAVSGLIAHWSFREGSGTVARDLSGHGADCDLIGATWAKRLPGDAVEFNGSSAFLAARDAKHCNLSGAFTISFHMQPSIWAGRYSTGVVSKKRSDGERGYVVYADGNYPTKITLRIQGTGGGQPFLTSASDVDEGVWQDWAVTYDPQSKVVAWYKNGKLDKRYESIVIGDTSNDVPLHIGHIQSWNGFFDGYLDDLEIYDRALSPEEIAAKSRAFQADPAHPLPPVKWRVVSPTLPARDVVVAGCDVREAGAKGDGKTDDTAAFLESISAMSRAGGGVVYVPAGRYVIRGTLNIPTGVTLRGDWEKPSGTQPIRGTILMAYAGRGSAEGRPFIALRQSSGVKDVAIWYPEQGPAHIVAYPFSIEQMSCGCCTVEDVTLVNSYQGIRTDYNAYLHYIHNVYGSPLAIGIEIDFVSDAGRMDMVGFGPQYWSASGLPGAPAAGGPHAAWMLQKGTGLYYRRNEWIFSAFVDVRGYKTGLRILSKPGCGFTNGQMYKYTIAGCGTAVDVFDAIFGGISFTECTLEGSDYGVVTRPSFNSQMLFLKCTIRGGKKAAILDGIDDQSIFMQQCKLDGEVERIHGDLIILGGSSRSSDVHLRLGESVNAVTVADMDFHGPARIVDQSKSGKVNITPDSITFPALPVFPQPDDRELKPAKPNLFVVPEGTGGPREDRRGDDTAAIQGALDKAAQAGGGVVLLPAGIYSVHGRLTVPSGVELRGSFDVEHHTNGWGTLVRAYAGRNDEDGEPFLTMKANSGLRGLTFYYPEQRCEAVVPYPWLIQGRGEGIYVVDVTATNAYKFIDFKTYRCDRHLVQYAAGAPLRIGIAVGGGSVGGAVRNVQFNPHYWAWCTFPDCPGTGPEPSAGHNPPWTYQYLHLDAFVLGDCKGETEYENAVFGSRVGLRFVSENGTGASGVILGHGTDGSMITVEFDGLSPEGFDLINSQLVSMDCLDVPRRSEKADVVCGPVLQSSARVFNTTLWGSPENAIVVHGGSLDIDLASFWTYGSMLVDGGALDVIGTCLGGRTAGDRDISLLHPGRATFAGCLSAGGILWNRGARQPSAAELANNRRG